MKKSIFFIFFLFIFTFQLCFANSSISIFTIRKSGTGMLTKLLNLLEISHQNNHLLYLESLNEFLIDPNKKGIVLIRDPRDVCVSMVFWHTNRWFDSGPHGRPLNGKELYLDLDQLNLWNNASFEQKLSITISHEFPVAYSQNNLEYELAKKALKNNNFFLVRYEDLVGSQGRGSDQIQYETIKKLLSFLKIIVPEEKIQFAIKNLYGGTSTFRKGQINGWKNYFTSEHIALFKEKMNHVLLEWQYEDTWNWDLK